MTSRRYKRLVATIENARNVKLFKVHPIADVDLPYDLRWQAEASSQILDWADSVFENAYTKWQSSNKTVFSSEVCGLVCLSSYSAPPENLSHVSPRAIANRIRHSTRKDKLYFLSDGSVFEPSLDICLADLTDERGLYVAQDLIKAISSLRNPSFGVIWDVILKFASASITVFRSFYGFQMLAFYSSEDNSFFGSLYSKNEHLFLSVHGHTKTVALLGLRETLSFLSHLV